VDAFMCYKQKCKVVSLNLAHPVFHINLFEHGCVPTTTSICRMIVYFSVWVGRVILSASLEVRRGM